MTFFLNWNYLDGFPTVYCHRTTKKMGFALERILFEVTVYVEFVSLLFVSCFLFVVFSNQAVFLVPGPNNRNTNSSRPIFPFVIQPIFDYSVNVIKWIDYHSRNRRHAKTEENEKEVCALQQMDILLYIFNGYFVRRWKELAIWIINMYNVHCLNFRCHQIENSAFENVTNGKSGEYRFRSLLSFSPNRNDFHHQ